MKDKSNRLVKSLSWLAYTNIWLSLGLGLMATMSSILFETPLEIFSPVSGFLIFFSLYTLNRQTDINEDSKNYPERAAFFKKNSKLLFRMAILAYGLALLVAAYLNVMAFAVLTVVLGIGIAYSVKCIPRIVSPGYLRLKDIFVGKTLVIAITWAFGTVLLSAAYASSYLPITVVGLAFFYVLIRSVINTVTFDMRDIRGDTSAGIKTIPVALGVYKTKVLLYALNTVLAVVVFYATISNLIGPIGHILNIGTLYVYFYIYAYGKKWADTNFLCDVVVDGEYLVIGILSAMGYLVL